jgi:cobalamin biosynthesis protein CobD/CbiB
MGLCREYFRIMDESESDAVLSALQAIIEKFEKDIHPLAVEMLVHLVRIYDQHCSDSNDDDELAAYGAVQALDTILAVMEVSLASSFIQCRISQIIYDIMIGCRRGS